MNFEYLRNRVSAIVSGTNQSFDTNPVHDSPPSK